MSGLDKGSDMTRLIPHPGSEQDGNETQTLVTALRSRAQAHPDRTAFLWLDGQGRELRRATFADLDRAACAAAAVLQTEGFEGERVLLSCRDGLDFMTGFLGCAYAGVVAVPVNPPQHEGAAARLRSVAEDAAPAAWLTGEDPGETARWIAGAQLPERPVYGIRELAAGSPAQWRPPAIGAGDLAFLQYTSGSTSDPKGVMVTHANLAWNSRSAAARFEHSPDSTMVTWLPLFHDMGLIYAALETVYSGIRCVMISPYSFLKRPRVWLEAITRYGGTHSAAPNFAYDLCVRRIPEEQRRGLSLETWRVALNGSEPVRASTLRRFADAFSACGFRPQAFNPGYGLAEATVVVTGHPVGGGPKIRKSAEEGREVVSVGAPAPHARIAIVDPSLRVECPEGVTGEVWVSGPMVARGYWRREEATRDTFFARLAATREGPFLRTGDLGFLDKGELYLTGRIKDLVIVAGQNHYPQDIEETVERCHPAIRPASVIAFSVDGKEGEELVVVAAVSEREAEKKGVLAEITSRIRQRVALHHEIRVHRVLLARPAAVPKTSSGKVQRRLCRLRYLAGELESLEERFEPEVARAISAAD